MTYDTTQGIGLLALTRQFDFVREAQSLGQNRGARVEAIQHWSCGQPGDSWCCEDWWMMHDIHCKATFEVPRMQAVHDVYEYAVEHHYLVDAADVRPGDTFFYLDDDGHAHHIGIVTIDPPLTGIAGNTSADGSSSNGDGKYEHALNVLPQHIRFARFPQVTP